jgi:hypothetical protein
MCTLSLRDLGGWDGGGLHCEGLSLWARSLRGGVLGLYRVMNVFKGKDLCGVEVEGRLGGKRKGKGRCAGAVL